ncbi:MAG: elongation factor P--(R)-beta-lysine ligase, partial [Spirochaetales bacterium]|nr:elongation factor P--(R)-beta-lysine ligase [Spirochaetales bacterium]
MNRIERLVERARIVAALRTFFDTRGYLAVETPALCPTPIPEAHIDLFRTRLSAAEGRRDGHGTADELYLLPSPEYYLKRLLAEGVGNLYEIAHSFRNGESCGPHHASEFTMLEYYTVEADSEASLDLTRELLAEAGVREPPEIISMAEAWSAQCGIDLSASAGLESEGERRAVLAEAVAQQGLALSIRPEETWEDLFQRLFLTYIEPALPRDKAVFLTDYPAAIPTLARSIPGTPWADRWELYLGGVEVANCFGEETDPARIAAFFDRQSAEKRALDREAHPTDPSFLRDTERLP